MSASGAIAVIGVAGRFPGARTVEELWRNLEGGTESISFFSESDLRQAGVDAALFNRPDYVRARGVLADAELFDAAYFGFSPREAQLTDPQQRVFLECAVHALEDAGCDPARFRGLVGVYAGAGINSYMLTAPRQPWLQDTADAFQLSIHNKNDHLTTRTAFKLDLRGPAITLQTACSTSLVAIATACQSLIDFQCDLALAGGVTVRVPQRAGYLYLPGGVASPDGHCRPFDARAAGTVDGSGVGVVVLKRLEDALAGDRILAVIRGWAINNDGARKQGYTAPGVDSQTEVIAAAQALAGVTADTIGYVEAHGTGTPLGDPIEIAALTRAFGLTGSGGKTCAIGSIKSNIGHLDAAAGVAGFIKAVLAVERGRIPPSLHYQHANPHVDLASTPFYVNTQAAEWPRGESPRRAGISAFGIGGTNAHVVIEEPPRLAPVPSTYRGQLLALSAKTSSALEAATAELARHLDTHRDIALADVAFTLQSGRSAWKHRRVALVEDVAGAVTALRELSADRVYTRTQEPVRRPAYFLFPGQGAQYVNMAAGVARRQPVFRAHLDECAALLAPHLGRDLRTIIFPADADRQQAADLDRTIYTQPALFTVEYALARLWMHWGVRPDAMLGHSVGEYVAACLSGALSLADALALVATRGRLIDGLPRGAMLAVPLPEQELRPLLQDDALVSVAAVNGPSLCTVSGSEAEVTALHGRLTSAGVTCRRLDVSHAFHSSLMDPVLDAFHEAAAAITAHAPSIPYLSNVTGDWMTAAPDASYWVRHLRQTVRFADGIEVLLREPEAAFIECGPGRTLKTVTRWHQSKRADQIVEQSLPHRGENADDYLFLLGSVGRLWLGGVEIDWSGLHGPGRRRVSLPGYQFDRSRHWLEAGPDRDAVEIHRHADISNWFYVPVWTETPPRSTRPAPSRRGPWLLFVDADGVGEELGTLLQQSGEPVTIVAIGDELRRLDEQRWQISPARRDHYDTLFDALDVMPAAIVHLWGCCLANLSEQQTLDRTFNSLLVLAQSLGARTVAPRLPILVATEGVHSVNGDEVLFPAAATVLGPCRVIPREDARIDCRHVDFAAASADRASRAAMLFRELCHEGSERSVAIRHRRRWLQRYVPAPLPTADSLSERVRDGGVYLISGGLGGVGFEIASWLARTARAKLVVFSRHPNADQAARLRAQGAELMVATADVTDAEQVRAVYQSAIERYGAVHGVVHAAGAAGGGLIHLRSIEASQRVLAPKIAGAQVLASVCDRPLDFFVLCSSLSAVIGRPGQVDYCAANAYLDCFAQQQSARWDTFTVSIGWPEWRGVGMARAARQLLRTGVTQALDVPPHPLFDARELRASGEEVFTTAFSARRHWVLEEHRIRGYPVVPGVAFIEMVRAALADRAGDRALELRDVLFIAPLLVRDDESREVRLVLTREDDLYRFSIESDAPSGSGSEPAPAQYASGRASFVPVTARSCDLSALIDGQPLHEEIAPDAVREDDLGPRWQNVKRAWVKGNEVVTCLELSAEFAGDLQQVLYHPALMDRAAGRAQEYLVDGVYLPVAYHRLRLHAPVPRRIFSYAVREASDAAAPETLTFQTVVCDERGRVLVEMEGFTQKRLNDFGAAMRFMANTPATAVPPVVQDDGAGMRPAEAIEALSRLLAHAAGPQIAVSPRDLDAEIAHAVADARRSIGEAVRASTSAPQPTLTAAGAPGERATRGHLIAAAWREVLGVDLVRADDNFFALGGDSVQAIQIIARLNDAGVPLTPQQFFQYQTVAALAAALGDEPLELRQPAAPVPAATPAFQLASLADEDLARLETMIADADQPVDDVTAPVPAAMQFSLFYFADERDDPLDNKYRLYLDGARYADRHGFTAVWTPERHFHPKGGLYPNPSVLCAALATITQHIQLRAGSVVLPLHHAARVVEEWSVIDNLSNGRVGVSFTSGWLPNDFAFFPDRYASKRDELLRGLRDVQALWRGDAIPARDGTGQEIQVRTYPRPLRAELPTWITCSGDPQVFIKAGELGANVLTALLTQSFDQAAERIALYRDARARAGLDPAAGCVTMMLHTFVGPDPDQVLRTVRVPLTAYLKSHTSLISSGAESLRVANPDQLRAHADDLAEFAFERYYRTASLIGTPETCRAMVDRLRDIGVNEIACLIDFGVGVDEVLASLPNLARLKDLCTELPLQV